MGPLPKSHICLIISFYINKLSFLFVFQTDYPVRERIFLLLDATQTAVGGAKGKFPEYYAAYYDLVVNI